MNPGLRVRLCIAGFAVLLPAVSFALVFTPTESEWLRWPEYCRARYVVSGAGETSEFALRVGKDVVSTWSVRLGDGWEPLHHYCAGIIKADRALADPDKKKRSYFVKDAVSEFRWYMERVPNTHPIWVDAAAHSCLALDKIGDATGLEYCDMAIKAQPENPTGYTAKSTVQRRHQQLDEARETLETGNKETNGESAELHYFLGLTCLDLKDFASAKQHAKDAYRLGYPLPGLRDRLQRAGYPLD